jgi:SAM-dependent methyltransferase
MLNYTITDVYSHYLLGNLARTIEGRVNPWAIAFPEYSHGTVPENIIQEYYNGGAITVEALMDLLRKMGIDLKFGSILDFGCDLGIRARSWTTHFESVTCVETSLYHLLEAERLASSPGITYKLSDFSLLSKLGTQRFDMVAVSPEVKYFSPLVMVALLEQFCDALAPGGIVIFELPLEEYSKQFTCKLPDIKRAQEAYGFPKTEVDYHMKIRGCNLVQYWETEGLEGNWIFRKKL